MSAATFTLEDMKLGKFAGLLFALLGVSAVAAQAQFSIYGMYQATRLSGMKCNDPDHLCSGPQSSSITPAVATIDSHVNFTGGWGGATYDFKTVGPVRLGIDVRAGEGHSNKSGTTYAGGDNATTFQSALGGLKGTFHTPIRVLHPYAEVAVGWSRTNAAEEFASGTGSGTSGSGTFTPVHPRTYDNHVVYQGMIGLDIRIVPMLDLRLPELGIGNMNMVGSGTAATTSSMGIKSVAVGIVLHFPAS